MIIVVPTCEAYADIHRAFVYFFNRHWKNCPYPRFFINGSDGLPGFSNVRTARDYGWIANLVHFLHTWRGDDNVLLLLDDYVLQQNVDETAIRRADQDIDAMTAYIRLVPYANNEYGFGYGWKGLSSVPFNEHYYVANVNRDPKKRGSGLPICLQPAIWNPKFIVNYFNPTWSPWQMEVLGSREFAWHGSICGRTSTHRMLTTKSAVYYYLNAIRDGKYAPEFFGVVRSVPELEPYPFVRDVAIARDLLTPDQYREVAARQKDGTYPKARYTCSVASPST